MVQYDAQLQPLLDLVSCFCVVEAGRQINIYGDGWSPTLTGSLR